MQTEIAQVEARVDALEGEAFTQASQVYPGALEAVVVLGKVLFYDKNLSVNRNTACGFCHNPETGFQGGIELINRTSVNQQAPFGPGSAFASRRAPRTPRTRRGFSIRRSQAKPNVATALSVATSGTCALPGCD